MKWTTREGTQIEIANMDGLHLLNVINYFYRSREEVCAAMAMRLMSYSITAPDMAADAAESAAEDLMEEGGVHWINAMINAEGLWAVIAETRKRDIYKLLGHACRESIELQEEDND